MPIKTPALAPSAELFMVMYRDQLVQHTQIAASEALSYININSRLCSMLLDPTSHLLGP